MSGGFEVISILFFVDCNMKYCHTSNRMTHAAVKGGTWGGRGGTSEYEKIVTTMGP